MLNHQKMIQEKIYPIIYKIRGGHDMHSNTQLIRPTPEEIDELNKKLANYLDREHDKKWYDMCYPAFDTLKNALLEREQEQELLQGKIDQANEQDELQEQLILISWQLYCQLLQEATENLSVLNTDRDDHKEEKINLLCDIAGFTADAILDKSEATPDKAKDIQMRLDKMTSAAIKQEAWCGIAAVFGAILVVVGTAALVAAVSSIVIPPVALILMGVGVGLIGIGLPTSLKAGNAAQEAARSIKHLDPIQKHFTNFTTFQKEKKTPPDSSEIPNPDVTPGKKTKT